MYSTMSIMTMLTTKSTREVCLEVVVVGCSSLGVFYYCPLWGSGYPSYGFPQQVGFVGGYFPLVMGYYCFGFFFYFWHYSVDGLDFSCSVVQNFKIVEWERVEKS
jgi:hypothetical protein